MGKISSLNIHNKKGIKNNFVDEIYLEKENGIENNIYSNKKNRQLCIFSKEAREQMNSLSIKGLCMNRFQEDITIEGVELYKLKVDEVIEIGQALIKVTSKGKRCFEECSITNKEECSLKNNIIFGKVIKEGIIKLGDRIIIEEEK